MNETEFHQESVYNESVSMINGDPLEGEIESMDIECKVDVESKENKVFLINDEESDDIWSNADQIVNENVSNIKKMVRIDNSKN